MNKIVIGIIFALGLVFLIGGSVFVGIFPQILKKKIKEELPLVNGSDAFDRWKETKVPISMKFYFFHLNNTDFKSLDDIELVERGPYIYKETRVKQNIKNINEELVSYEEKRTYRFEYNGNHNDSDHINFINFPILGVLQNKLLAGSGSAIFNMIYPNKDTLANETGLFMNSSVDDLLFNGIPYKIFGSPFLASMKAPKKYVIFNNVIHNHDQSKSCFEEEWVVNNGKNDIDQIGQLKRFNKRYDLTSDKPMLNKPIWVNHTDKNCTELKGTDGTLFAPFVEKDDILYGFEPQLCRTVFFKYWKETDVQNIDTLRFKIPEEYFENPNVNPENDCYCIEDDIKKCQRSGTIEIANCVRRTFGAPIVMSAPYYMHNNKNLTEQFKTKLKPKKEFNEENYGTYVDVEPMTGTTLNAVRRMQMSIKVKKANYPNMPQLEKSEKDEYIVPVFWIEESGKADEDQGNEFKSMVTNKKKLANGIGITVIVVGAVMTIASIYLFIRNK